MTSDESRGKNNDEFRRLMLAGALSMSPELAAVCDRFETATIEELDAALAGGDQRSSQFNDQTELWSTIIAAPAQTPLATIEMPAIALTASTADLASPSCKPETIVATLEAKTESDIPEFGVDNAGSRSPTPAPMLAKTGIALSELRRAVVSVEGRSPEALPTRFARAMSLIRSQFAGPGAVLPSR